MVGTGGPGQGAHNQRSAKRQVRTKQGSIGQPRTPPGPEWHYDSLAVHNVYPRVRERFRRKERRASGVKPLPSRLTANTSGSQTHSRSTLQTIKKPATTGQYTPYAPRDRISARQLRH
uniref:Uncharacterized protein n=1 Tax=Knipowitschia caucasica TaxID=637954 RepID=A0AAV2LHH5_KNICA